MNPTHKSQQAKTIPRGLFYFLIVLLILLLAGSCSPVRKSQVKLIGNYFNTISAYPEHIKQVNGLKADLVLESNNLRSAIQPTDSARVKSLLTSVDQYEVDLKFPDSVAVAVANLEQYIQSYYVLVPNGFDAYKALKGTTESIGGIFGLKSIISSVLPDREVNVTSAKRRKIYAHFKNNQTVFIHSLQVVEAYFESEVSPLINTTFSDTKRDVELLFDQSTSTNAADYYFKYNRHFLIYFQQLTHTRTLARHLAQSLNNIQQTEMEVQRMTNERRKITKDSRQVHRLIADLERMEHLYRQAMIDGE